jgi:hypothetical protein
MPESELYVLYQLEKIKNHDKEVTDIIYHGAGRN